METIDTNQAQERPRLAIVATAGAAGAGRRPPAADDAGALRELADLRNALTECDGWTQAACDEIEALATGARSLLGDRHQVARTLLLRIERRAADLQNEINCQAEAHGANYIAAPAGGAGSHLQPALRMEARAGDEESGEVAGDSQELRNCLTDCDCLAGEACSAIGAMAQAARSVLGDDDSPAVAQLLREVERCARELQLDINAEATRLAANYIAE